MKPILAVGLAVALAVSLAGVVGSRSAGEEKAEVAPWIFGQSMSQRRSYVAAAELGGKIYVAGGAVGETGRFLDIFQRFDPRTNSWTTLRRLPEPTRAGAGAALDGKVYVIGGQIPAGASRHVYAFDVARGRWQGGAPPPGKRVHKSGVALRG